MNKRIWPTSERIIHGLHPWLLANSCASASVRPASCCTLAATSGSPSFTAWSAASLRWARTMASKETKNGSLYFSYLFFNWD